MTTIYDSAIQRQFTTNHLYNCGNCILTDNMSVEDSWVFDSLVCFLHGPVWNAPLQTFIEEKSIVFDPNIKLDENSDEIKQLYEEYKNLVDFMLGSFMEEMQISPEQFETACAEGRVQLGENPFQFHSGLFQQIWAANDLKIFIRMMTQRNVELQLQALDLIEKNQLSALKDEDNQSSVKNTEQVVKNISSPSSETEDSIAKSLEKEQITPEAALTPDTDNPDTDIVDKFERLNLFFEKNHQVDPNEISSRQEYLRQQRDKIVEIKRKTRTKMLMETVTRKSENEGWPSSAQVAKKLLEKKSEEIFDKSLETEDSPAMQLRRTLAKRLRAEVLESKNKEISQNMD